MNATQENRGASFKEKETGWNSRGWVPLKYPESAVNREDESFAYFPLHKDVVLACVRELLVLDGTLDSSTLKISENKSHFKDSSGEFVSIPRFSKHMELLKWPRSAEQDEVTLERKRKKAKKNQESNKRMKIETNNYQINKDQHVPSAEEIALAIIERGKVGFNSQSPDFGIVTRPPRKVSEADSYHSIVEHKGSKNVLDTSTSQEISTILSLQKRTPNGCFLRLSSPFSSILHLSISSEAILRDVALSMTETIVESFPDKALRLLMGYKAPSIRRERLIQLLAGFLFDTSHAMFAWDQTEQEILARHPETKSLDTEVQNCLFDDRALKKIGGFEPCSLLPHAISISRHRKRNTSWELFASTVQGKRMLEHHNEEKHILSAGKRRRGQRLRQRHWLTTSLLGPENDKDIPNLCSLVSSESDNDDEVDSPKIQDDGNSRQSNILANMPGTKAILLAKKSSQASWGVCLGKEGNACVVGRAATEGEIKDENRLRCGDLILYGSNGHGQEAHSPLCAWIGDGLDTNESWFEAMVDLFKTNQELHLVVQRVA